MNCAMYSASSSGISRVKDKTVHSRFDQFFGSGILRAQYRLAKTQGLRHNHPPGVFQGWQYEYVTATEVESQSVVRAPGRAVARGVQPKGDSASLRNSFASSPLSQQHDGEIATARSFSLCAAVRSGDARLSSS